MSELTATQLRKYMSIEDVDEISETKIESIIDDVGEYNDSDRLMKKYRAAYLLAKSVDWRTVKKSADVEFNPPNPDTYLDLLNQRKEELQNSSQSGSVGFAVMESNY